MPQPAHNPRTKRRRLAADWFQADAPEPTDDGQGVGSLRDYLARHLQQAQDTPDRPPQSPASGANAFAWVPPPGAYPASTAPTLACGRQLNGMDTEMNAGIEHLLPTPAIRLRVVKERLVRERAALELKLEGYGQIERPSAALREEITLMQTRLATLCAHERQIDTEIRALFLSGTPDFLWSDRCQRWRRGLSHAVGHVWHWVSLTPLREKLHGERLRRERALARLHDLSQMLATHQASASPTAHEVSDIINAYDRTLVQLEAMRRRAAQPSWWVRGWQRLLRTFRTG